jgi:hypothetical protein
LIAVEITSIVKNFLVNKTQWDEMANALAGDDIKMKVTLARFNKNGEARQYYFVLGQPKFKSPLMQNRHHSHAHISLSERSPEWNGVISKVKKESEWIVNSKLVDRLLHRSTSSYPTNWGVARQQQEPTPDEDEQNRVISEAHQRISSALALDLQRRPRLSRTNAGMLYLIFRFLLLPDIYCTNSFIL